MIVRVGFRPVAADAPMVQRMLKRGYGHCWMAREIDVALWLWLEWTPRRLVHGLVGQNVVDFETARSAEVLALPWPGEAGLSPIDRRWPRPVLSCVQVVADALGVRVPPWATPWELACALRLHGARAMWGQDRGTA